MILVIGEILFDVFEDRRRLGGAPFNYAYHLKKMGFDVRFVSRVGQDEAGERIRARVRDAGFDEADLQIDDTRETGLVNVFLDETGTPDYHIRENAAYDFIAFDDNVRRLLDAGPEVIYFGSLIQRTRAGLDTLHRLLKFRPETARTVYDMNLRKGCIRADIVGPSLEQADVLKLSRDELETAATLLEMPEQGDAAARALRERYSLSMVCVTDGEKGSTLFSDAGRFASGPPPSVTVKDSVGAGDAYAAMLTAGMLRGRTPDRIIRDATAFSARVCTLSGALPDSDDFYGGIGIN